MKSILKSLPKWLLISAASLAFAALCARAESGKLVPVSDVNAAWLANARANYPLSTCAVSGEKLADGDMGKPREFVYREAGKPDRLIRFCCGGCLKDFNKDPAKYLKAIDAAAQAKAAACCK
jgi:hypothetical protein